MNAEVTTTAQTQTANEILGRPEKTQYYVIIKSGNEKIIIRCGEETHKKIQKLTTKK